MTRRTVGFIVTLALSLLVVPLASDAQPLAHIPTVSCSSLIN
jgi:hypothetical protein